MASKLKREVDTSERETTVSRGSPAASSELEPYQSSDLSFGLINTATHLRTSERTYSHNDMDTQPICDTDEPSNHDDIDDSMSRDSSSELASNSCSCEDTRWLSICLDNTLQQYFQIKKAYEELQTKEESLQAALRQVRRDNRRLNALLCGIDRGITKAVRRGLTGVPHMAREL